jgi:hypothetical protein
LKTKLYASSLPHVLVLQFTDKHVQYSTLPKTSAIRHSPWVCSHAAPFTPDWTEQPNNFPSPQPDTGRRCTRVASEWIEAATVLRIPLRLVTFSLEASLGPSFKVPSPTCARPPKTRGGQRDPPWTKHQLRLVTLPSMVRGPSGPFKSDRGGTTS